MRIELLPCSDVTELIIKGVPSSAPAEIWLLPNTAKIRFQRTFWPDFGAQPDFQLCRKIDKWNALFPRQFQTV